jgi:hypothetical protein
VYLINGDMLTGNVGQLEPVKFHTAYGMLTVPMDEVWKLSLDISPPEISQPPTSNSLSEQKTKPDEFVPVPIPDAAPGPIRPLRRIVPVGEVR